MTANVSLRVRQPGAEVDGVIPDPIVSLDPEVAAGVLAYRASYLGPAKADLARARTTDAAPAAAAHRAATGQSFRGAAR